MSPTAMGGTWQMMAGGMGGMMWIGALLRLVATLLLLAALTLLVVWLWQKVRDSGRSGSQRSGPTALAILERRYARGELPEEEFEQMRRKLEHGT